MQITNEEILENWVYNYKNDTWKKLGKGKKYVFKRCLECNEFFFGLERHKFCCRGHGSSYNNRKRKVSEETKKKMSKKAIENGRWKGENNPNYGGKHSKGINNPNWKGGYHLKNIPIYDTYSDQLKIYDEVRRNRKDSNILEVKCAYCGKWFIPVLSEVSYRLSAIRGQRRGYSEHRLYCSDSCKEECPIFNKQKWPKGFKQATSREVQPELRQMVFKRDDYKCVKCGSNENLHCHHIEGIRWEPLESADMDKCITVCKDCHKKIHMKKDCGYNDFKCGELNRRVNEN